jgi:hypothetical protein
LQPNKLKQPSAKPAVRSFFASPPLLIFSLGQGTADAGDGKKRIRDEQIEALVRDRDAAIQKARVAEQDALRWKQGSVACA